MRMLSFLGVFAVFALSAQAETLVWCGPNGGAMTNAENWVVSGSETHQQPTKTDTIVFNPGEGVSLTVNVEATDKEMKTLHIVKILSGDVTFVGDYIDNDIAGHTAPWLYLLKDKTNEVYVAENASLLVKTVFCAYDTSAGHHWLEKTGGGSVTLNIKVVIGSTQQKYGNTYVLDELHVIGGSFTEMQRNFRCRRFTIENGASASYRTYSSFTGFEVIDIKKGGTFDLCGHSNMLNFAGLFGEGTLGLIYSTGSPTVRPSLYSKAGPSRFAGVIKRSTLGEQKSGSWAFSGYAENEKYASSDESRHFIVAGSNTLNSVACYTPSIKPEWGRDVHEYWTAPILGQAGVPIWTEDEDGNPIRLHANLASSSTWGYGAETTVFEGCGDWFVKSGTTTITGNQVRITGKLGVPSGATVKLGNGTDAAADFTDYPFGVENEGTVVFQNAEHRTITAPSFAGAGDYSVQGPLTITDAQLPKMTVDGGSLTLVDASLPNGTVDGGALTLTGASRITASSISLANGGHLTLDGPRVIASGPWTTDANSDNPYHAQLKGPGKTLVKTSTDASLLTVKNGATFYFGTGSNDFAIPDTVVEDGGSYAVCDAGRMQGTATDVRTITLNGGSIDLTSGFDGTFAYSKKTDTMKILIGEKGGTIGSTSSRTGRYVSSDNINLNVAVEDAAPADADGGTFRIDCGMSFTPTAKWSLKGPLALADAFVNVNRTCYDLYEDGKLFGSGDLVMESGAWLGFAQTTDAITPHVAWGEGRKLRVTGAARLNISPLVSTAWKDRTGDLTLTVGPSGATESSLVVEPGAALAFWNSENLKGMPSTFHVRVNGGVACHADGRTKAALVFQGNNYTDFLTYDANLGLTNFNNYVNGFTGGADSTVLVNAADRFTLEAGETSVGAIKVAVNDSNTKNVKIPAGATLKVGNGTDPAVVLFQTTGSSKTFVPFDGAGSIDFGTSKGVFFYPRKNNVYYVQPVHLRTRLKGQNGVNYLCVNGNDSGDSTAPNASFSVDVANDYEGDTVIDMASVIATDKDAFSSGDVIVRGSRLVGGAAVFGCEGPFANNFTISKFGRRLTLGYIPKGGGDRVYYPSSLGWGTLSCGALEFAVAGTRITGDVHVVGRSRISSYFPEEGSEVAIFEGVVSGDTLEIVDSFPKDNDDGLVGRRHKFVFCNANSITGGVEVLNGATAVLRGANPSFGTGMVTLSGDAALRFENTAELDFTNKLFGAGTIQLGATKEVLFNGDISEFEGVIDLCGLRHEFSKVPPFAFTNTTGRATVAFKGGLGTVDASALELTGDPMGYDLAIGAGTVLDLGGETLTVRRLVEGEKTQIVNGELVELKPKAGMLLIVR